MRIVGPNATARVTSSAAHKKVSGSGFALDEQQSTNSPVPAAALRTIGGIDALLTLQGDEEPAARRRRAVKRGRTALDTLDDLKVELLSGALGLSTLGRLRSAATGLRDGSGDLALDGVLAEIELRVEVEIAKLTPTKTLA
jgi:hypothetical protein